MAEHSGLEGQLQELLDRLKVFIKTGKAHMLDDEGMDAQLLPYIEALNKFFADYKEMEGFINSLSSGKLMVDPPPRRNLIANPLKNLHAQLLHITWQAQQVSSGDYQQSVDFMGEFAEAFNRMTEQLMERERRMNENFNMLVKVLENTPDIVIVIDEHNATIFQNRAADRFMASFEGHSCPYEECKIRGCMFRVSAADNNTSKELYCAATAHYYNMTVTGFEWGDSGDALLLTLQDVTASRHTENQLRSAAYIDPMTGVGNRNGAMEYLARIKAGNEPFALVFADMDKLKVINDLYGHNEGDAALRALAEYLRSSLRERDRVFRIGGDEFIVVMGGCDEETASRVMRRLRERLKEKDDGRPYELTFSFGVYAHDGSGNLSIEDTLESADALMYEDKRQRRMERSE